MTFLCILCVNIGAKYFCIPFFNIVQRWVHSRFFKTDINNDYGIYPENGDYVVVEAVDRNTNYETGGKDQTIRRQISENEYDKMYEDQVDKRENEYDNMYEDQVNKRENDYDKMYD